MPRLVYVKDSSVAEFLNSVTSENDRDPYYDYKVCFLGSTGLIYSRLNIYGIDINNYLNFVETVGVPEKTHNATEEDVNNGIASTIGDIVIDSSATGIYKIIESNEEVIAEAITQLNAGEANVYTKTDVDNLMSTLSSDHTVFVKEMTETTYTIAPNVFYKWGEVTELDISLAEPEDETIYSEYMFQFTSGDTATTLSLPDGLTWYLDNNTILANKTYQVSIINNLAVLGEF